MSITYYKTTLLSSLVHHSMNNNEEMTAIPKEKNKSLRNLFSGYENSSMMTSEQAIYRNVPPARQLKTISTISLLSCKIIPIITPIGVNKENINSNEKIKLFLFGNTFAIEIPRDIPAAPLCKTIAKHNSYT